MTYTLRIYTGIWGNKKDGWTVDNSCEVTNDFPVEHGDSNKKILSRLKEIGFLSTSDRRRVDIEEYGEGFEIYAVKGYMPIGSLTPNY